MQMSRFFGPVVQQGYVVPDLKATMNHWIEVLGVGPFFLFEHLHPEQADYKGQAVDLDISAAFAYCGEQQIELIQQHNDKPSVYLDFLKEHPQGGLHHLAFWTQGNEALLERLKKEGHSLRVAQRYGANHSYLETDLFPGTMVQLMHASDAYLGMFQIVKTAAQNWDGTEPVRTLA
jgi:hypothetical protein